MHQPPPSPPQAVSEAVAVVRDTLIAFCEDVLAPALESLVVQLSPPGSPSPQPPSDYAPLAAETTTTDDDRTHGDAASYAAGGDS